MVVLGDALTPFRQDTRHRLPSRSNAIAFHLRHTGHAEGLGVDHFCLKILEAIHAYMQRQLSAVFRFDPNRDHIRRVGNDHFLADLVAILGCEFRNGHRVVQGQGAPVVVALAGRFVAQPQIADGLIILGTAAGNQQFAVDQFLRLLEVILEQGGPNFGQCLGGILWRGMDDRASRPDGVIIQHDRFFGITAERHGPKMPVADRMAHHPLLRWNDIRDNKRTEFLGGRRGPSSETCCRHQKPDGCQDGMAVIPNR